MGASLAMLSATFFKHTLSKEIVGLYTMGTPRLGNRAFATHVKQSAQLSALLLNSRDPVPHTSRYWGYRHPAGVIYELFMDPAYTVGLMSGLVDNEFMKYLFFVEHKTDYSFSINAGLFETTDHMTYFIDLS